MSKEVKGIVNLINKIYIKNFLSTVINYIHSVNIAIVLCLISFGDNILFKTDFFLENVSEYLFCSHQGIFVRCIN